MIYLRRQHVLGKVILSQARLIFHVPLMSTNSVCADFWNKFGNLQPAYGPYTTPAYSDAAYDILGLVIQRVSGQSYGDFIQQRIFTPLNMTRSFVTKPEDDSIGFISNEANFWSTSLGFEEAYV